MARAVPGRLLRPGGGHGVQPPTSASAIGAANLLCADVGGTSLRHQHRHRRPADREHDVRARARPRRQRAVHRDLELGAGGGSHRLDQPRRRDPGRARAARAPIPGPACLRQAAAREPTMTDAFLLIGILDPGRFAGGALSARRRASRGRRSRRWTRASTSASASRYAYRMGLNNIAEGIVDISIEPRRRPARLLAAGLRRGRPDDAARAAGRDARASSVIVPPHPGLFSALGPAVSRPRLRRQPQRLPDPQRRHGAAPIDDRLHADGGRAARRARRAACEGVEFERSIDARLVGQTLGDAVHRRARRRRSTRTAIATMIESTSTTPTSSAPATASTRCRCRA